VPVRFARLARVDAEIVYAKLGALCDGALV
jgi:hypothetical protein